MIIQYLGVEKVSPSFVSKLAQEQDKKIKNSFHGRLFHTPHICPLMHCIFIREGLHYVSISLLKKQKSDLMAIERY